jgi:hypothetical protein
MYSLLSQPHTLLAGARESQPVVYRFVLLPDSGLMTRLEETLVELGVSGYLPLTVQNQGIVIAGFSASLRMEDTLMRWTQRICSQLNADEMVFNNFSGIPPHTLLLRVQDPAPMRKLVDALRKLDMYLTGNDQAPLQSAQRFYLPVLENIPTKSYNNIVYRFGRCEWHGTSPISQLVLQKSNGRVWKDVQHFSLNQTLAFA